MSDEAAFLRAVALAPADDDTRLVYADWLDEQDSEGGRARAAALRLDREVAIALPPGVSSDLPWGQDLPPPENRYPPTLRALTEAADALSVDWLVAATWLGREVRSLGERFVARVPGTHRGSAEPLRDVAWREITARVREMFETHTGDPSIRERFAVPIDYALFAAGVGGLTVPDEYGMTYFDALFDPAAMADRTKWECDMWAKANVLGEHLSACGLWLFVGFRDKHDFHLCCDRASPFFGVVVDMHDRHPWIHPPHGPVPWEVQARSFLGFLRRKVGDAEYESQEE